MTTGAMEGSGTNSHVFLTLFGKLGTSPRFQLTSKLTENPFSCGIESCFSLRTHKVGELTQIRVSQDGSGHEPDWFLENVLITDESQPQLTYQFNCNDWVSADAGFVDLPLFQVIKAPNSGEI